MRNRYVPFIAFLLFVMLLGAASNPQPGQAQDGGETCEQLVQRAFSELGTNCASVGRNAACYGFETLTATLAEDVKTPSDFFTGPGYRTELTTLDSITTSPMNLAQSAWGIGVMNVQADVPTGLADQTALYVLVGDVEVTNDILPEDALVPVDPVPVSTTGNADLRTAPGTEAEVIGTVPAGTTLQADGVSPDGIWLRVAYQEGAAWVNREALDSQTDTSSLPFMYRNSRTPMQSFHFRTGQEKAQCLIQPPSVLVVQSPQNIPVNITANGVDIRLSSVIFLRTLPDNKMQIIVGSGKAIVYPDTPHQVIVEAGASVTIPLDALGTWIDWHLLSEAEWEPFGLFEDIPANIWLYSYINPIIIQPSGVGQPSVVVQTSEGASTPTPPPAYTFPLISMDYGTLGEALQRTAAWEPITIGDSVCPDWVLYHSDRGGDWDIYRLGNTGPNDVSDNVSQGPGSSDIQPSYSQDGQWAAFVSDRDLFGSWEVYLARTDGSKQVRLTYNAAADINPVWGPGNLIAFESNRDGNWELYTVDVSGDGEPVRTTDNPANDINPFWSPDGNHLVFQSDRDGDWEIYMLNLATGELTKLTSNSVEDQNPILSHDGKMMAWTQENSFGVYDLWLMDLETGEVRQLTDTGADVSSHDFSPDDTFIAYQSNVDGDFDIFAVTLDTGAIKMLTNNDADDRAPTFRCDSSIVIYHSDVATEPDQPTRWDLFQVNPLPLDGPANLPTLLTGDTSGEHIYPLADPREERNSREGQIPEHPKNSG
jgi:Tol biopolymer transport system component